MKYEKPDIKAQKFTTQDFLSNSSVDDELPGLPDKGHEVLSDSFMDFLGKYFRI